MSDRPGEYQTNQSFEYVVGGSLPLDAVSYVKRSADDEFFAGLKAGKFCYVLNSRQMGKSSLRVRTMARLQADGIVCVSIDMTAIGSAEVTAEQWYLGVLWAIVKQVREQTNGLDDWRLPVLRAWWVEREGLSFVQRWGEFIEVLLGAVSARVVIFVDEIDSVLGLGFRADDFFASIRECYNRRVDDDRYERLTFALLGVCAPQDLIQDKRRTPFNIGQAIELNGFTREEAITLATGLPGGEEMLREVLGWTGGQPFLTQRVCRLMLDPPSPLGKGGHEMEGGHEVEGVVRERIIRVWESQDEQVHFQTIGDRMMADESLAGAMLGMYQRVLTDGGVGIDGSAEQIALRLTGAVVKWGDRILVMNRIYEGVFGDDWVSGKLAALRPYGDELRKWQESADEAWLLRGDSLEKAKVWVNELNRKLAPDDYQFLTASQELEREEERSAAQEEIAARDRANQILQVATQEAEGKLAIAAATAAQTISVATRKANRRNLISLGLAGAAAVVAAITGIWASNEIRQANSSAENATREQKKATTKVTESDEKAQLALNKEKKANDQLKIVKADVLKSYTLAKAAKDKEQQAKARLQVAQSSFQDAQTKLEIAQKALQNANKNIDEAKNNLEVARQETQNQIIDAQLKVSEAAKRVEISEIERSNAEIRVKQIESEALMAKKELEEVTSKLSEAKEAVKQTLATLNENLVFDKIGVDPRIVPRGDSKLFSGYEKLEAIARNFGISADKILQIEASSSSSISSKIEYNRLEENILKRYGLPISSSISLAKELSQLEEIPQDRRTLEQKERILKLSEAEIKLAEQFKKFIDQIKNQLKESDLSDTKKIDNLEELTVLNRKIRDLNAAVLYPLILNDRLELLLITPGSPPLRRTVKISKENLYKRILRLRGHLANPRSNKVESQMASRDIYDVLIKPIEEDLKKSGIQTIIYSPDGALRYIPLSAMYDGQKWLIESYSVNNFDSLSNLDLKPQVNSNPRILAAALTNPISISINNQKFNFSSLASTAFEIESIKNLNPNTSLLFDKEFTPKNISNFGGTYEILHLATHGLFNPTDPEQSFILFGNGERITLRNIDRLNLRGVDLVVLSGSETALGGITQDGLEVFGLGYQFQRAGVRAVIASLWSIDDSGTQVLMNDFYTELRQGKSKVEALRKAQINALRRPNTQQPYYWAPFILIGNGL